MSAIADDTNLNLGTLTGSKFIGNATGSVSAIADDTNLNLGTLTASQFIGNTPGTATGISAAQNIAGGTITATTFHGDGSGITGAGVTAFVRQDVTAQSGTTTINLNNGNAVYLTHSNNTTIAFSNVPPSTKVVIARTLTNNTISWPAAVKWDGGSAPTLASANSYSLAGQVFNLVTYDGGTTWYGWEGVNNSNTATSGGNFSLYTWGLNQVGELGINAPGSRSSPIQIPGTTWSTLPHQTADSGNITAIKSDGTLWVWGNNSMGQLGQNDRTKRSSPVQVPGSWSSSGSSTSGTLAVKTDGTLWAWGSNETGRLGINQAPSKHQSSPVQIPGTWGTKPYELGTIGAWNGAIKSDGTLWVWGWAEYGQLAQNNRTQRKSPVQVPGTTWRSIGGVSNSAIATKTDGTLWTWGNNPNGELGQNNLTQYSSPVQIPGTTWGEVTSYGGWATVSVIKTDGTLWNWGNNDNGSAGQNNTNDGYSSPVQVPGTTWKQCDRGDNGCVVAVKTDGTMWVWGNDNHGTLGLNDIVDYSSPVQLPGTTWHSVNVNNNTTIALKS